MMKLIRENFYKSPILILSVLALAVVPKAASAGFIADALADGKAQAVIRILGSIGIAMSIASLIAGFIGGSNDSSWLMKSVGIVAGLIFVIQPTLLSTIFGSMGL